MTIAPGEVWDSIRQKHRGMRVEVRDVTPGAVNVKVIRAGAAQNNRKIRGKIMHIGNEAFMMQYKKVMEAELATEKPAPPPAFVWTPTPQPQENGIKSPMTTAEIDTEFETFETMQEYAPTETEAAASITPPEPVYDFKIDDILERTVKSLKRWGGQPVKSYVLTQYVAKNLNAERTRQLIAYGVAQGKLETWEVTSNPLRPTMKTQMVGLAGGSHTPAVNGGNYPGLAATQRFTAQLGVKVEQRKEPTTASREAAAVSVSASFEKQYQKLTEEQRDEIAKLAAPGPDGKPGANTQELQKAYAVMGAVIGRIKREHGLEVKRNDSVTRAKKVALRTPEPSTPTVTVELPAALFPDPSLAKRDGESWAEYGARRRAIEEQRRTQTPVAPGPATAPIPPSRPAGKITHLSGPHTPVSPALSSFEVTVLQMVPAEVTLTIAADSFAEAEEKALVTEHVTEVLSVSKVRK